MKKIKVVIVDDSAFMRKAIENMLSGEEDIEIVGTGKNGEEAVELAATLKPDVMTLDIEMPKMDGLTALQKIMASPRPVPIIMVSSLTQEGANTTLKALETGAVDFIPKEKSYGSVGILKIANELKSKIRRFAGDSMILTRMRLGRRTAAAGTAGVSPAASSKVPAKTTSQKARKKIIALGTSTGGPQSLQKVIPLLPEDLGVPILIVQHMPANFTASLAARLDSLSKISVIEAQGGETIQPNVAYIAKGGKQMILRRGGKIELLDEDPNVLHNPSVDVMASSVAEIYGADALGVIMTGMGSDGKKGLTDVKNKGGFIISQDEASSIVYGMPKAVVDAGIADEVVPLEDIAARIVYHIK